MISAGQIAAVSVMIALLFVIFSLPMLYNLTNMVFTRVNLPTFQNGAPTYAGIALHAVVAAIVYFVLVYFMTRE
jgi:hypothetical protein